jgi:hypothetical protein
MHKLVLAVLFLAFGCCFPLTAITIAAILLLAKVVSSSPVSFQPAECKVKKEEQAATSSPAKPDIMKDLPSCITYEQRQEQNVERGMNPGWDAWSPENKERTESIKKVLEANRAIAEQEMKEEIERESKQPTKRTVEQILSEHRSKMARSHEKARRSTQSKPIKC